MISPTAPSKPEIAVAPAVIPLTKATGLTIATFIGAASSDSFSEALSSGNWASANFWHLSLASFESTKRLSNFWRIFR